MSFTESNPPVALPYVCHYVHFILYTIISYTYHPIYIISNLEQPYECVFFCFFFAGINKTVAIPKKAVLIVRATEKNAAKAYFGELGIKIVSEHRFLGGFVGEKDEVHDFVLEKVTTWTSGVNKLAIVVMVCDIVVPKSLEIQWQTDQNDDVPMVSLSAMLRYFHQFLVVLLFSLCCQKLVKLTPED